MKGYSLVVSGLGGQGVITISRVLATAAFRESVRVRLFEGTGISQRGGSVFVFVRLGETHSPKIPLGGADAIISLEISEVCKVIGYLRPKGEVWTNAGKVQAYFTKVHPESYPRQEKIEAMVRRRTSVLHVIPADRLAQEAGSPQALNMVMLGAFSRHNALLKTDSIIWAIQQTNNRFLASNLAAFWKGNGFSRQEGPME